jgi:hypothetical protein
MRSQHVGWAGLALLAVLLLIAVLVWSSWRSGLLAVRPDDLSVRLPDAPALPRTPMPNPQPAPLPRPGPGVEN